VVGELRAPAARPVAQITAPAPGTKLRLGATLAVRIRAVHAAAPLRAWSLRITGPSGFSQEIAGGTADVDDVQVATIPAEGLSAGVDYQLRLDVEDSADAVSRAETAIRVPDPQFALIPLAPGNRSVDFVSGVFIDGGGDHVAISGPNGKSLDILERSTGRWRHNQLPDAASSWQLSRDGKRLFVRTDLGPTGIGVGFVDLESSELTAVVSGAGGLYSIDLGGRLVAVQKEPPGLPPPDEFPQLQYFLYSDSGTQIRQVTNDPAAIRRQVAQDDCPQLGGSKPLITADGEHVVLITSATLGVAPDDPSVGCRVFMYDVATDILHYVLGLPRQTVVDVPTLSDDGRWLSYTAINYAPDQPHGAFASLADLETGTIVSPIGGVTSLPSFDSVVSGDGRYVVVSAHADLDPRVGNADLTREIFVYDRIADEFHQVSETSGGVVPFSGSCELHKPTVNGDASVIGFSFFLLSGVECTLAGPQRSEIDGMFLGRVRAVRKRPGNQPPLFAPVKVVRIEAGSELQLPLAATDPDGDPITFFAQVVGGTDVPPGSSIEDHHDGTATFDWPTRVEHAGVYQLRLAAFDEGGGEVFHDVTLAVCNEVEDAATQEAIIRGVFAAFSGACNAADRNGDQRVTAADLVLALGAS
jgi:hypothetical protein